MTLQEDFDKAFDDYRQIVMDQMELVSQCDRGEKTEKEAFDQMLAMEIAKFPSKDRMEELLEDMPDSGIDIREMKGRFDSMRAMADTLFTAVKEKLPVHHFVKN